MLAAQHSDAPTRRIERVVVEVVREAIARVTEGDLNVPDDLPYDRSDEIGHVSRSFRTMTARLEELDPPRRVKATGGVVELAFDLPMPSVSLVELVPPVEERG